MATTVYEVAVELGRPTPAQDSVQWSQWSQWIARTYRDIERRFGVAYSTLDPGVVDDVVLLAVAEHARNPDGVDSYTVSVDDGSDTKRYTHSSGRIVIRDEWWAMLSPAAASGVGSTQTYGMSDYDAAILYGTG